MPQPSQYIENTQPKPGDYVALPSGRTALVVSRSNSVQICSMSPIGVLETRIHYTAFTLSFGKGDRKLCEIGSQDLGEVNIVGRLTCEQMLVHSSEQIRERGLELSKHETN